MGFGIQLTRWIGHQARRIYGMLGESAYERLGRALLDWIERHGGMATVRD